MNDTSVLVKTQTTMFSFLFLTEIDKTTEKPPSRKSSSEVKPDKHDSDKTKSSSNRDNHIKKVLPPPADDKDADNANDLAKDKMDTSTSARKSSDLKNSSYQRSNSTM